MFERYGVSLELLSVGFSLFASLPLSIDASSKNVESVGGAARKQFLINHFIRSLFLQYLGVDRQS